MPMTKEEKRARLDREEKLVETLRKILIITTIGHPHAEMTDINMLVLGALEKYGKPLA